jgi:hypothetical protein
MHERIYFIHHHGKQVLVVDLSKCSAAQVADIVRIVPDYVTAKPRGSVRVLTDFTGASFDQEAMRAMKEAAVFDKPYIKKSALVGAESIPEVYYESLKNFSRREFHTFKTRQEALDWLVTN